MRKNHSERVFIGVGANLDDPETGERRAIDALGQIPETRLVATSSLYRTAPVGYLDQPDFVNAVAELETRLDPPVLLSQLLSIEQRFGRKRSTRNAPRTLDLDMLLYGDRQMQTKNLTLPHPRMAERAFVLVPLAEIAPEVAIGRLGTAVQLLETVRVHGVERIGKAHKLVRSDRVKSPLATMHIPEHYRYIVVEGPIGAGKTSLAQRLASHVNADLLLEAPDENPFLPRFYEEPVRHALATQLFFLFQRIQQLRDLKQIDLFSGTTVSDFLFDKDALFARLNLADDELHLYHQIYQQLAPQAPVPDLVIYLQASHRQLVERVRRRAVDYERNIDERYLARLADEYQRFFYQFDAAPLLIVNSDRLNFVDDDDDFDLLLQRIREMKGPRAFFSRGD